MKTRGSETGWVKMVGEEKILVSPEDMPLLLSRRWRVSRDKRTCYAVATLREAGRRTTIRLHRLIAGAAEGQQVDHINGNGLDCRRENLRICTNRQNARNRRPWMKNKISRFKWVTVFHPGEKWNAQICVDVRVHYLGSFKNEEEAALAYDRAAREAFGAFARTNFRSE